MSERGRGRGGNSRGGERGRGGGRGGGQSGGSRNDGQQEPRKREAILDLAKYADQRIRVKFSGGREIEGTLKGWDQLLNLVLDDVEELVRDPETNLPISPEKTRTLGLTVVRGTALVVINPVNGFETIGNPFLDNQEP